MKCDSSPTVLFVEKVRLSKAIYLYYFDMGQIPQFQYASQQVLKHFTLQEFDKMSLTSGGIRHVKSSKPGSRPRIKFCLALVFALVLDQPQVHSSQISENRTDYCQPE